MTVDANGILNSGLQYTAQSSSSSSVKIYRRRTFSFRSSQFLRIDLRTNLANNISLCVQLQASSACTGSSGAAIALERTSRECAVCGGNCRACTAPLQLPNKVRNKVAYALASIQHIRVEHGDKVSKFESCIVQLLLLFY